MSTSFIFSLISTILVFFFSYFFLQQKMEEGKIAERMKGMKKYELKQSHYIEVVQKFIRSPFFRPGFFVRRFTNERKTKRLLDYAGCPTSFRDYCSMKQVGVTFISWFIFFSVLVNGQFIKSLLVELLFMAAILKLPDLWLSILSQRRCRACNRDLPHFIDMLGMSVEAGLNFYNAFLLIGEKAGNVLGREAKRVIQKVHFGFPLEESFSGMAYYISSDELRRFTIAVKQAKKLGVSIADTLKIQSHMIRTKQKQRAEELIKTASVKISLPLVFLIFPALLIIYIGPGIIRLWLG